MGRNKGTKIGLGEFLGDAPAYTIQDSLPTGPRQRTENDQYGRRGDGRYSRQPSHELNREMRSDNTQWRGAGASGNMRDQPSQDSWRGGNRYDRRQREPMERPSHLKLNLTRKGENSSSSKTSSLSAAFSSRSRNDNSITSNSTSKASSSIRSTMKKSEETPPSSISSINNEFKSRMTLKEQKEKEEEEFLFRPKKKNNKKEKKSEKELENELQENEKKKLEEEMKKNKLLILENKENEIFDLMKKLNDKGPSLTKKVKDACKEKKCESIRPFRLMKFVLDEKVSRSSSYINNPNWTNPEEYGNLLSTFILGTDPKTEQLNALYRVQEYYHSINFPKGLLEHVFIGLYQNDILDEEAFITYKYDVDDNTPGKMNAIIQLTQWLTWLETAKDEEDDDDEIDEEAEAEYMEAPPMIL